jgi:NAD(P)-dependent dehydrogenase (short-subunit alcohol dehydrogenase family)
VIEPLHFVPGSAAPTGRVALVTGGARRVGAVVVRALAARG